MGGRNRGAMCFYLSILGVKWNGNSVFIVSCSLAGLYVMEYVGSRVSLIVAYLHILHSCIVA